jgi:acyl-[acyl-carrier-protein]-phospholipid O-acyltransferase / long-chain-fatty-acid--[acyl-carrier-protein] ligase
MAHQRALSNFPLIQPGYAIMGSFSNADCQTTIFEAVLAARKTHGGAKVILQDADGTALTYDRLVLGSLVLGRKLDGLLPGGNPVGLMLPNVAGLVVTVLGLNAFGRTVSMLNYTAGFRNLASALKTGQIRQIVTSRRFIDKANLTDLVDQLRAVEVEPGRKVDLIYLEDVRAAINWRDKLVGAATAPFAARIHARHKPPLSRTGILLFTSGTEGAPKGVALTNPNIVANARQIFAHAQGHFTPADRVLNPLPMFHSFGLTAGTIMPIVSGLAVTLYPSPLHYREVAKLCGEAGTTVLFATDTFMAGYAKAAKPGDLDTIRFVVAGAERVKEATRALWSSTKAEVLEGYGATECAPVIAVNRPGAMQPGSVGRPLPSIETRLEPVEGIESGGRLLVRGPNVMAGYMTADAPGVVVPLAQGWHDTGDIVTIDDGFITIRGRAKRFAKLGGEMVSLAAVESLAASLWPDANHVVVSLPDPKKGEQLVLVTDKPDAEKMPLLGYAKTHGFPELWVPRVVLVVASIPVLGSGKTDLPATLEMVRQTRSLL